MALRPIRIEFDLQLFAGEKTEPPSEKRMQDARDRGQIPKSMEVNSAVVLLGIVLYLYYQGDQFFGKMFACTRGYLAAARQGFDPGFDPHDMVFQSLSQFLDIMTPVLLVAFFCALASNLAQVGFLFTTYPLEPDFNKLNPFNGMEHMFSWNSLNNLVKSIAKIIIISLIPFFVVGRDWTHFMALNSKEISPAMVFLAGVVFEIVMKILVLLLILSLLDYGFLYWRNYENLKMSKDEIKDEFKSREGDPKIKQKIRERGRQLAQSRMFQALPKADVVITNPIHFAVALQYDPTVSGVAPIVLAKGTMAMAVRIRELALKLGIPVVQNEPLAQMLYRSVDIGDEISEEHYAVVATILAPLIAKKRKLA